MEIASSSSEGYVPAFMSNTDLAVIISEIGFHSTSKSVVHICVPLALSFNLKSVR